MRHLKKLLACLALVLLLSGLVLSVNRKAGEPSKIKPLADLPEGIEGEPGKVTLHADYPRAVCGFVKIYLINRSGQALSVPNQDGDAYVKLEARNAEGVWDRAQAHGYSDCGNSYMTTELPDGTFLTFVAPYPTRGEKRAVRYRMYSDVGAISNEGEGFADPREIEECRYDAMGIRFGDAKVVEHVLFNSREQANGVRQWPDLRETAIFRLEHLSSADAAPLLKRLLAEGDLNDRYYEQVIRVMSLKASDDLAAYAKSVLSEGLSPRRVRFRWASRVIKDAATQALLVNLVMDPATPDAEGFLQGASGYGTEEGRALLSSIAEGSSYRQNLRDYASFLIEVHLEKLPVRMDCNAAPGGGRNSLLYEVTLTNESSDPVRFSYTRPEEIVGFWVQWRTPQPEVLERFAPVQKKVKFFTGDEKVKPTQVVLGKGELLSFTFDIADYFDFSRFTKEEREAMILWPRLRLPGIQSVPAVLNRGSRLFQE